MKMTSTRFFFFTAGMGNFIWLSNIRRNTRLVGISRDFDFSRID